MPNAIRIERHGAQDLQLAGGVSADAILEALEAPGEILKTSPKWVTKRVGSFVVKSSLPGRGFGMLRHAIQRKRLRRGWEAALALHARGVGVPAPRAFVERRAFGLVTGVAMVSEYLEGQVNVEDHARALVKDGAGREKIQAFLTALAEAVNELCDAKAYHADLSGKNIFTAAGQSFAFIDLDSVRLDTAYGLERRLKNHAQLYDSFCDLWGPEHLAPFIARMSPNTTPDPTWLTQVQQAQQNRRSAHSK